MLPGNTPGQIGEAVVEVFNGRGYTTVQAGLLDLVFEKKGSRMNNFAYGSWMGEEPIWVRVKLRIVAAGEQVYRLDCRACLVKDKGSAAEEEIKINRLHRGPYEKLMDEVAARLGHKRASSFPVLLRCSSNHSISYAHPCCGPDQSLEFAI